MEAVTTAARIDAAGEAGLKNPTAIAFMVSGAVFFCLGAFFGTIAGTELVAPDLFGSSEHIVFGRMRSMHTNSVMFGFVVTMLIGAVHYLVPRLVKAPLYSERLGVVSMIVWNASILAGVTGISFGVTQSREYAEMFYWTDIGLILSVVLQTYNLTMTVKRREEPVLYVSVWYFFAYLYLGGATYVLGNAIWVYPEGALAGVPDAVLHWFYGHNVLGLIMTPLAVGAAYYVIPRASKAPLYSHTLSHIGFWSIIVMYTHIGTHHLLQTPAPTWLKLIAVVDSIGMVIPVGAVIVNLWMTARGRMATLHESIGGRFVFMGTILYLMTCIQGPMQSLPIVQRITHYTYWVPAHAHMAVLGFVGFIGFGTFYYVLPFITGRPLYSVALAKFQYWLMLFGMAGKMSILTAAGLIQGHAWFHGETVYRVLPSIHLYNVGRLISGILVMTAAFVGLYNVLRTLAGHQSRHEREAAS